MDRYQIALGRDKKLLQNALSSIVKTEAELADKSKYITAFKCCETLLYRAVLQKRTVINHKLSKWQLIIEDDKEYKTFREACVNFKLSLSKEYQDAVIYEPYEIL